MNPPPRRRVTGHPLHLRPARLRRRTDLGSFCYSPAETAPAAIIAAGLDRLAGLTGLAGLAGSV